MEKTNKNGVCFVCVNGEWLIRPCPAKNGKGITKSLFTAGKYLAKKATPVLKEIAKKALQEAKEKAIEMAKHMRKELYDIIVGNTCDSPGARELAATAYGW
jgi:hypothetical protein